MYKNHQSQIKFANELFLFTSISILFLEEAKQKYSFSFKFFIMFHVNCRVQFNIDCEVKNRRILWRSETSLGKAPDSLKKQDGQANQI